MDVCADPIRKLAHLYVKGNLVARDLVGSGEYGHGDKFVSVFLRRGRFGKRFAVLCGHDVERAMIGAEF